jgi:hypothetical protein
VTTVRPFTTCVVVVTVAPDPPEVVTAPPTCGAPAVCAPAAFVVLAEVAEVVLAGKECVASATAAAPVPARSAAAVQLDMRLTRLRPSLRVCRALARTSGRLGPTLPACPGCPGRAFAGLARLGLACPSSTWLADPGPCPACPANPSGGS